MLVIPCWILGIHLDVDYSVLNVECSIFSDSGPRFSLHPAILNSKTFLAVLKNFCSFSLSTFDRLLFVVHHTGWPTCSTIRDESRRHRILYSQGPSGLKDESRLPL